MGDRAEKAEKWRREDVLAAIDDALDRSPAETPAEVDDELRMAALAGLGLAAIVAGRWTDALECVVAGRALLAGMEPGPLAGRAALDLSGVAAVAECHTSGESADFDRLRATLAGPRSRNALSADHAVAMLCLGSVQHVRGHWGEAAIDLLRGLGLASAERAEIVARGALELALVRVRQGRWDDAADIVRRVGADPAAADPPLAEVVLAAQGLMLALEGRLDEAAAVLADSLTAGSRRPTQLAAVIRFHAATCLAIARNDWLRLHRLLDDAEDPGYRRPFRDGEWRALRVLAAWHLGSTVEQARRIAEWSRDPRAAADPYYWTFVNIGLEAERRELEAIEAMEKGLGAITLDTDPLGRAWIRIVAGTFFSRHGDGGAPDPVRGLESYEQAQTELVALGAGAYARLTESIIRQTTAELSRARAGAAREVLTAQQLRVAELVAEGYTSVEIGQILHLSSKTIDFHVGNVVRRLGLRGRREIARRMRREE